MTQQTMLVCMAITDPSTPDKAFDDSNKNCKSLENKETVVDEVKPKENAVDVIKEAINNYIESFCK